MSASLTWVWIAVGLLCYLASSCWPLFLYVKEVSCTYTLGKHRNARYCKQATDLFVRYQIATSYCIPGHQHRCASAWIHQCLHHRRRSCHCSNKLPSCRGVRDPQKGSSYSIQGPSQGTKSSIARWICSTSEQAPAQHQLSQKSSSSSSFSSPKRRRNGREARCHTECQGGADDWHSGGHWI